MGAARIRGEGMNAETQKRREEESKHFNSTNPQIFRAFSDLHFSASLSLGVHPTFFMNEIFLAMPRQPMYYT
jgi:hypothetical protein